MYIVIVTSDMSKYSVELKIFVLATEMIEYSGLLKRNMQKNGSIIIVK